MRNKINLLLFSALLTIANYIYAQSPPDQQIYFISANGIRVREAPMENSRVLGALDLNDEVIIVNSLLLPDDKYIEIKIIKTDAEINFSEKYFIAQKYLSDKAIDYKIFNGKYFIVLNIASDTLRLYERICVEKNCHNKMIMETEVVVGEDKNTPKEVKGKGRSIIGSFRVTGWSKFYEDAEGHYPSWYKEGYPDVPGPDNRNVALWFSKHYMPKDADGNKNGKMRGAFGWYTMFVGPNPFGQWVHGTLGWGENKDYYIKATKTLLLNVLSDPRSSGCTRNNNEAIAYLRHMVNIGTPVIKVYAVEKIFDPSLPDYTGEKVEWNYVMTKIKNLAADREEVLKKLGVTSSELDRYWETKRSGGVIIYDPDSPLNQVIEVGTYQLDTIPYAIKFTPGESMSKFGRKLNRKGNVYGIKSKDMHGIYYVDTGVLSNYTHPTATLEVSGFLDEVTPFWMLAN